jgi:hypothetical protein
MFYYRMFFSFSKRGIISFREKIKYILAIN